MVMRWVTRKEKQLAWQWVLLTALLLDLLWVLRMVQRKVTRKEKKLVWQ